MKVEELFQTVLQRNELFQTFSCRAVSDYFARKIKSREEGEGRRKSIGRGYNGQREEAQCTVQRVKR